MRRNPKFKIHLNIDPTMHRLQFCFNFRTVWRSFSLQNFHIILVQIWARISFLISELSSKRSSHHCRYKIVTLFWYKIGLVLFPYFRTFFKKIITPFSLQNCHIILVQNRASIISLFQNFLQKDHHIIVVTKLSHNFGTKLG